MTCPFIIFFFKPVRLNHRNYYHIVCILFSRGKLDLGLGVCQHHVKRRIWFRARVRAWWLPWPLWQILSWHIHWRLRVLKSKRRQKSLQNICGAQTGWVWLCNNNRAFQTRPRLLYKVSGTFFLFIHSKITMAGNVVAYYIVIALVHTLK